MLKIGILGCAGRMGKMLLRTVWEDPRCKLSSGLVTTSSKDKGKDLGLIAGIPLLNKQAIDNIEELFENSDIVIDFTTPESSLQAAKIAKKTSKALVIGTTGFTDQENDLLKKASQSTRILWAANTSIGINILMATTKKLASVLDKDSYDIEILEMHHRYKKDSPSGTALILGEAAAAGRGVKLNDVAVKSRDGIIGERKSGDIGFVALRGGNVIGEHSVIFASDDERIEITHKVADRSIFAKGAVKAALWLMDKENGLYSMQDVLGIN